MACWEAATHDFVTSNCGCMKSRIMVIQRANDIDELSNGNGPKRRGIPGMQCLRDYLPLPPNWMPQRRAFFAGRREVGGNLFFQACEADRGEFRSSRYEI